VGERLWMGELPRHGTRHSVLLGLTLTSVRAGMST